VVARQGEHVWLVGPGGALELLADLRVSGPQVRRCELGEQRHAAVHSRRQVGVVREVHQGAGGVLLDPHGRLELADELRGRVPGIRVRAPDLRLAEVLVVDEDVREGRGDRGVEHAVDGDVQGGRDKHKDVHVLVLHLERRSDLHAVRDQARILLLHHGLRALGRDLRVPVEGPVGEDFGDLLAVVQLPHDVGHEAVREDGAHGLPAEGPVVLVEEFLELIPAPLPVNAAVKSLRHAGRLDDVEALQDGGLVRDQLPQEQLALRYVPLAERRAVTGHVLEHESGFFRIARAEGARCAGVWEFSFNNWS